VKCIFETGDWTRFRVPLCVEIDFHRSECGPRTIPYYEAMDNVWADALQAIQKAYLIWLRTVLFTHGYSTSQPGTITARSQIRDLVEHEEAAS